MLRIRIRDPVLLWPLDPDTGEFFWKPDLESPTHIYQSLETIFGVKKNLNSLSIGSHFYLSLFKNEVFSILWNLCLQKKEKNLFTFPPPFCCCWIRDPVWKKSGSTKNIPDPQHCTAHSNMLTPYQLPNLWKNVNEHQMRFEREYRSTT
jgi:hypothetical protein